MEKEVVDKYDAYEKIDKVRNLIYSCINDWPRATCLDKYYLDRLSYPFDCILEVGIESLGFGKFSNGYYIGQVSGGKRSGYGMYVWPKASLNGYIQVSAYIGHWNNNQKEGDGVYFSMLGEEIEWYVSYEHYSCGKKEGYFYTINYEGLAEGEVRDGKVRKTFESDSNGNAVRVGSSSGGSGENPVMTFLSVALLILAVIVWIAVGFWTAVGIFLVGCLLVGLISSFIE